MGIAALFRGGDIPVNGAGGVIFTPWLHGNRCPFEDPKAAGMFFNIKLDTGKTEMLRAVLESGHYLPSDPVVRDSVARSLEPLKGVGALLLGCTHYGLISDAISAYLGPDVILVGAADASAQCLVQYLRETDRLAVHGGSESYYTSGSTADFEALAPVMLGYELKSRVNFVEPFALDG